MDAQDLIKDFIQVASLAGVRVSHSEIEVEFLKAPHHPPSRLPSAKMAVYVFTYGDIVLKVGKAGPNSGPRYTSQHYRTTGASSTLAASILQEGKEIGIAGLTIESVGEWIRKNTSRTNFLVNTECGVPVLTLLEAFLQCRLTPHFEGFASQRHPRSNTPVDRYVASAERQRQSSPAALPSEEMPTFKLKLQPTYFKNGFFNVAVDYDRYVRQTNGPVKLRLGRDGTETEAKINRQANKNGTARIYGGVPLRIWFQNNFEPLDIVNVDLTFQDFIVLEKA